VLSDDQLSFTLAQRVAHLATAAADGNPHVVPVCFAYYDGNFWLAIDEKPKRTTRLTRLRNIEANPKASLLFDRYDDDWSRLAYVLVHGHAEVLPEGRERSAALAALRRRYQQYQNMDLEGRPLIRITPERVTAWGAV
jgi:PPOX class probable F420-dependent enzyme